MIALVALALAAPAPRPLALPLKELAPGVEMATVADLGGDANWAARIVLVQPGRATFAVRFDPARPTIAAWRARYPDALAILNGSFYSIDGPPGAEVRPTCDLIAAGRPMRGAGCHRQDALFFAARARGPDEASAAPLSPPAAMTPGAGSAARSVAAGPQGPAARGPAAQERALAETSPRSAAPVSRAADPAQPSARPGGTSSRAPAPGSLLSPGPPAPQISAPSPARSAPPQAPAQSGRSAAPVSPAPWSAPAPQVLAPADFHPEQWAEALKGFPALVRQGAATCPGTHYCAESSRTAAVAQLRDGRILLFASQWPAIRREVGKWLAEGLGAVEAVNLDGGPEATLALRGEPLEDAIGTQGVGLPLVIVLLPNPAR